MEKGQREFRDELAALTATLAEVLKEIKKTRASSSGWMESHAGDGNGSENESDEGEKHSKVGDIESDGPSTKRLRRSSSDALQDLVAGKELSFFGTEATAEVAKSCFVPILFGQGIEDDFIQPHHSDRVFDAYVGDKNIIKFEGDHNSPRPQFYFDSISIFFNNVLQPPEDEGGSRYFDLSNDYFNRGRWSSVQDLELSDEILGTPSDPPASSTEDAIRQLRSRRPMSATVVPADISSKDNQPDSELESRGSDAQPSTSNMISLEFARDSPHGSLGPGSVDDDEYVEYSLDMLADFPTNVEEEERMLMVAIFESLKDSEVKAPPIEEPSSGVGGTSLRKPEPPPKNEAEGKSLLPVNPAQNPPSSEAEASRTCSPSDTSNAGIISYSKNDTSTAKNFREGQTSKPTSHTETLSDNHRTSDDADMADRTKVTVEIEKNPTTNVIDGLLRRWDIFRNR